MRYFEVKKEELVGSLTSGIVYSDGEYAEEPDETEARSMTTGYNVWTDNEDEVLEKIKADYPASEWQNNEW